jgi:dihydroxy-acid dehydratase
MWQLFGMYTANTMSCLTEAMGMSLPEQDTIPAVYADRVRLAKMTGERIVELLESGLTATQVMNEKSIRNALHVDMGLWVALRIQFFHLTGNRQRVRL